jgi:predicted MPP superfamily phosphohydrolase
MRSLGQFALFIVIAVAIVVGWHYYLWVRLVRDPGWPSGYARAGAIAILALGASLPLGALLGRFLPRPLSSALAWVLFVWTGFAFLLLVALLVGDVLTWVLRSWSAFVLHRDPDPDRRTLLARGIAGAAGVSATVLSGVAVRSALAEVDVVEIEVRLPRLARSLSGLNIVQLTDLHVGPTIGRKFIEQIVEKTNAQRPDIVAITGDLVDGGVASLREQVAPLARLASRYGVYFVTGNHEYYSGVEPWLAELARLGIRVLRNERVTLGDRGGSVDLAGVDDATAHQFGGPHGADYERALGGAGRGADGAREVILLAHQPSQIVPAMAAGEAGLVLSGHTHGGQIWPFGAVVRLAQPYVAGLHRHNPRTQIYVSRGTGYWGPPMRLFAPAEITKLVLTPG